MNYSPWKNLINSLKFAWYYKWNVAVIPFRPLISMKQSLAGFIMNMKTEADTIGIL